LGGETGKEIVFSRQSSVSSPQLAVLSPEKKISNLRDLISYFFVDVENTGF